MVTLTHNSHDPRKLHRALGYTMIGLIVLCLIWGPVGARHARFVNFIVGPVGLTAYLRDMLDGRERRSL